MILRLHDAGSHSSWVYLLYMAVNPLPCGQSHKTPGLRIYMYPQAGALNPQQMIAVGLECLEGEVILFC